MGTRADFYIGRDPSTMEWLGSIAMDGYPDGWPAKVLAAQTEQEFRTAVAQVIAECGHGTTPEQGWPWPWKDSGTTDYGYCFDLEHFEEAPIYPGVESEARHVWWAVSKVCAEKCATECVYPKCSRSEQCWINEAGRTRSDLPVRWPDMSNRQNVATGPRSGLPFLVRR